MKVGFDPALQAREQGLVIGYAVINNVSVLPSSPALLSEIDTVIKSVMTKYASRSDLMKSLAILSMRELFRRNGVNPSEYAPSAEALLKRIVDGKGLYHINNAVESNNLGSMKFELPIGVYNLQHINGDVLFAFGGSTDKMTTMAKGEKDMYNFLLTRDANRLFGSPVSDSPFTKVDATTRNILLLVYGTCELGSEYVQSATTYTANKIVEYCGGEISALEVLASKQ